MCIIESRSVDQHKADAVLEFDTDSANFAGFRLETVANAPITVRRFLDELYKHVHEHWE
jgi:hypothetical protein